jgi:RNA polymerase sigma-70 factor (ECF subfamily)
VTQKEWDRSDEAQLIAASQRGDLDAFAFLMKLYKDRVFNTALRFVGNWAIAEELTQDIFISVYRNIGGFKGESKFSTWLYRVTVNHAKNRVGYLSRKGYFRSDELTDNTDGDGSWSLGGRTPSPGEYAQDKELIGILMECFKKLSDNDRRIIILKDFEGLNYDEIAEVLSINLGTVKSRLSRARERLKEMMKDYL